MNSPSAYMGPNTATTATKVLVNGNTTFIAFSTLNIYINGNLYQNI